MADAEALLCDRGCPLRQLQTGGMQRDVVRAPVNFAARRAALPAYRGKGRQPVRGALVRPLPRTSKGRTMAATPPDRHETWQLQPGPTPLWLHAEFWDDVVCAEAQPGAPTFSTALIHDPRLDAPLLLHTALPLTGAPCRPSIVTAGRWKGCPGRPSRCWARHVKASLLQRVVSGCPNWRGSGGHLEVCRGTSACYPYGLLGSYAKADVGQASAAPCRGALGRRGGAA